MKKNLVTALVVVAMIAGIGVLRAYIEPPRTTAAQEKEAEHAAEQLDKVKEAVDEAKANAATAAEEKKADAPAPSAMAPDVYKVLFETTKGSFEVEVHKAWAPLGAQRFYQLVNEGFFDGAGFFRVVPGFVVQFGLAADPAVTAKWEGSEFPDDPVTESNEEGYLTFATRGPNTRTTQLFINYGNNARLDGMGFAPFGKVVSGMDVVKKINPEYGERPRQDLVTSQGSKYLKEQFPRLDFINKATLVK